MKRSPISRLMDEAARRARLAAAASDPSAQTAPASSAESAADVGMVDSGTGDWVGFGLVNITPVGQFRVG